MIEQSAQVGQHVTMSRRQPDSYVVECRRCGVQEDFPEPEWLARAVCLDRIEAFTVAHEHPPILPLTPEEKERIRIRGIHRRGALRCRP